MKKNLLIKISFTCCLIILFCKIGFAFTTPLDMCAVPPFMSSQIPPLVMLVMGRDHKLYYEAYNDASDLNEDGVLDVGYNHSIDYYGYFDSYKCYRYDAGSQLFEPVEETSDKYCRGSAEWSGNFLNWLTMSRMDVLRKVLYGGYRSVDTASETILEGVFIPQDAHSWGKEYAANDTQLLTPYPQPASACTLPADPAPWNQSGKILFVTYDDDVGGVYGNDHDNMISSFSPLDLVDYSYLSELDTTDSYDASKTDRLDTGNYILVTEFYVDSSNNGTWEFSIDSDDGSEAEIDGTVVTNYYGAHGFCRCNSHFSTISLSEGWHRLVVRLRENYGQDGVLLWYKNPTTSSWTTFGASSLQLRAPEIDSDCRLKVEDFIQTGTPGFGGGSVGKRILFCVTSLSDGEPHRIRVIKDSVHRIWEWASKERPVCDNSLGTPDEELFVRVKVCDSSKGLEPNCYQYPNGDYKPIGLLQKYGQGTGNKICSKSFAPCENDFDCGSEDGSCIYSAPIYFGLLTGSYIKNLSGGVLRKNVGPISEEIDTTTGVFSGSPGIVDTINTFKITGFLYDNHSYHSTAYGESCGWITTHPLEEGQCRMWGNPIGEMMYETERYFAGKGSPTSAFEYSSTDGTDNGLSLPLPDWEDPYNKFPSCSKPSMLVISDINPSYDSDKIPGSSYSSFSGDLPGLNATQLASLIGTQESLDDSQHFIGQSGNNNDFICTAKDTSNLGDVRGLCPEEPTKQGSYYSAAVAYYGKTSFEDENQRPDITTYSVALSSPVPDIKIQVGSHQVTLVPIGKSVSGCLGQFSACAEKCSLSNDGDRGLLLNNCSDDSYCPSDQIVDFYVTDISPVKGQFRINFEDVEQGADHDMDAIVTYDYEVLDDNSVRISLSSDYASGCIDQVLGFVISGTTEDGVYLPVRDVDATQGDINDSPQVVRDLPLTWTKTFTVNNNGSSATLLKNPLWYAAKWGGFSDINGNNIPDADVEWDKDLDGIPDNYFYVVNPLKLEQQLEKALKSILKKTSSGTSVSVLTTKTKKGSLTNQAVFYQQKDFGSDYKLNWVGYLYTYWLLNLKRVQNIREDNVNPFFLDITGDNILDFFVNEYGNLNIAAYSSAANGTKQSIVDVYDSLDDVHSLWEAGEKLRNTNPDERKILYAGVSSNGTLYDFDETNLDANVGGIKSLLSSCNETVPCLGANESLCQHNLIKFVRGEDISGCRSRDTGDGTTWKLGDIIYSTPKIVDYKDYSIIFVGSNDGMLHAFREGKLSNEGLSAGQLVRLCADANTTNCNVSKLGQEEWAFIPKNVMPYLKYLARPSYGDCHLYLVDLSPFIIEDDTNDDGYIDKRVLIGGLRFGGACGCASSDCVNPPPETCADPASGNCTGLSSYFALDITDPESPKFLWEYSHPDMGFSYSGPAYIKRKNKKYVMFLSGPTNYQGDADTDLRLFILQVKDDFGLENSWVLDETTHSALASFKNSFGGRLFTEGIDYDDNDTTDAIFFGVNKRSGSTWLGNVLMLRPNDGEPPTWEIKKIFNSDIEPVTAKVEYMKCFDKNFIYFGTGRWFFKTDEQGQNDNDIEHLYGVNIDACLTGGNCNINSAHNSDEMCNDLSSGDTAAWKIDVLDPREDGYFKERTITDPTVSNFDLVFFTTTQPSADVCSYGGRSRMWALNCATGGNMTSSCPGGIYKPDPTKIGGTLLLQLSRGNIEDIAVSPSSSSQGGGNGAFSENEGKATNWMTGIPPESPTPLAGGAPGSEGEIILWLEK